MLRNVICAAIAMIMATAVVGESSVEAGHRRGRNTQCCGTNHHHQRTSHHNSGQHHYRSVDCYQNMGWSDGCCQPSYSYQQHNCGCNDGCNTQRGSVDCCSQSSSYQNMGYAQPVVECCGGQSIPVQSVAITSDVPQSQLPAPAAARRPSGTFESVTVAKPVQPPAPTTVQPPTPTTDVGTQAAPATESN